MSVPSRSDTIGQRTQCSRTLVSWERCHSTSFGLKRQEKTVTATSAPSCLLPVRTGSHIL